jgi:Fe-S-cluster formation regulator IscX/YfhJ|tara:strand:+ start:146 stop:481 length:336 start_codon:yes stop_codon:yes gene_type:complete
MTEKKVSKCKCGKTLDKDGNCDGSHADVKKAAEELKQEMPEVITRSVNVEGLKDLEKLISEMESIDKDQYENMDKMYALDVTYNGKPSNPYFTLCRFLEEIKNKMENDRNQ